VNTFTAINSLVNSRFYYVLSQLRVLKHIIFIGVSVELLKLKLDPRIMKGLKPMRFQNPSIMNYTQWHLIAEDGKLGYKFRLFPWFPHVLQYGLCDHQTYRFCCFRRLMKH